MGYQNKISIKMDTAFAYRFSYWQIFQFLWKYYSGGHVSHLSVLGSVQFNLWGLVYKLLMRLLISYPRSWNGAGVSLGWEQGVVEYLSGFLARSPAEAIDRVKSLSLECL